MTFVFNFDALRGAVFRKAFARELPDMRFATDPATIYPDGAPCHPHRDGLTVMPSGAS
jgi:hypothetical protein